MTARPIRILPALAFFLAACGGADAASDSTPAGSKAAAATESAEAASTMAASGAAADLPSLLVYKTNGCMCCNGWVEHLQAAGFEVEARNVRDLMSVKRDAGVPVELSSCHTALVDGYVVEGHVPREVLEKLLAERPDIAGISVPGMPVGSPGMEGPGAEPYEVIAFDHEGNRTVYAEVDPR